MYPLHIVDKEVVSWHVASLAFVGVTLHVIEGLFPWA
jgi:hypothetical protein